MSAPKEGIFIFRNSRGFGFRVKQNKFILVTASGYNSKQSAIKGLNATRNLLNQAVGDAGGVIVLDSSMVTDLTVLKKKNTKKK